MIFKFKKDYRSLKRNQFGSNFYEITLYTKIIFELSSFFGRLFSKKRVEIHDIKYIQLGCSDSDVKKKYLNLDFYKVNFFKKNQLFYHDLRYTLPFNDNIFCRVFSEHTIEHLCPSDVLNLFKEVYRVLQNDGVFTIVTPDLKKYIDFYKQEFNQGINKDLLIDKNRRQVERLYVDAVK